MAQCIANPIYDAAFKFLMEDDRCVKILLSALLKKEVVSVKVRPHEYAEKNEKRISIYRVDFGATIREQDGTEHLIIVELQKTWRPTEILRFRKYLGLQYEDKRNVNDDTGIPIPIVSIYILGHAIGDLKEPVVYVKRQYLDYDSQEIKDGVPCTFVECLTHDSIIVQIPYLKDTVRNHLEQILGIFNQKYVSDESDRFVYIKDRDFSDKESQTIINRLAFAAADPEIRYAMNIEDEVLGELEGLDTKVQIAKEKLERAEMQLAERDSLIAERNSQLADKDSQLADKDSQLADKDIQLADKDIQLADKDSQLADKDSQLADKDSQLADKDSQLADKDSQLADKDSQLADKDKALLNSAKALKEAGLSIDAIAKMTNLTAEVIEKL